MEDPASQNMIVQFGVLVILTLLNGFFSASEMALVSLNRSRVNRKAEDGHKNYIRLVKVLENPNQFLSTIQVGITFIGLLQGASLSASLGYMIASWFGGAAWAQTLGTLLSLVFLTYISIVLGELYPKRIAMNMKESLAVVTAPVILVLSKLVAPFVWLLSASTNFLSRITPMSFDDTDDKMTRDEIAYMLTNSEETLEESEIDMLQGVFSLDEMVAREVMVPRTDAFMVDIADDAKDTITAILKQNYSRIPVYEEDKDHVVGVLHTKSLLKAGFENGFEHIVIRRLMQDPLFVPETIFVNDLLAQFRSEQKQMAILLDEYGGVSGLVTLEDLVEEIVGNIEDETDEAEVMVRKLKDGSYIVQGNMTLNEFNEEFGTNLESDDVDTIAGFYLAGVGTIPDHEENANYQYVDDHWHITMTNNTVKNGRVTKVKLWINSVEKREEET